MSIKSLIVVLSTTVMFGLLSAITPLWVRWAVLGLFMGYIVDLILSRNKIIDKYSKRLNDLARGSK